MKVESAKTLLDLYIECAARILRAQFGVNAVESLFFDAVDLLRVHPTLKGHILLRIADSFAAPDPGLLDGDMVPRELIELIAHELRWKELRQFSTQRVLNRFRGDWGLAVSDISMTVLEAFSNEWEDRVFYKRYSEGQPLKGEQ